MAAFVPIARETAGYAVLGEVHGTEERTLVATGTFTATAQQEFSVLGIRKLISIEIHTTVGGTQSTVPTVEYFDIAAQAWVVILTGAAITAATGDVILTVGPHAVNTTNLSANSALYTRMRINMTHGNANNHAYSISVSAV